MPYCTQCGNQVKDTDVYCERCGAPQHGGTRPPRPGPDPLSGISARSASMLCYIPLVGWVAAIVVLASEKFRRNRPVRFHAFQGIYLFVAWLIVEHVIGPMVDFLPGHMHTGIGGLLSVLIFGTWIFMLIKVSQEQAFRLPILGELAERSLSEQK